jgi:hypothetical protein
MEILIIHDFLIQSMLWFLFISAIKAVCIVTMVVMLLGCGHSFVYWRSERKLKRNHNYGY